MSVENSIWLKYRAKPLTLVIVKILIGLLLFWFLYHKIASAIQDTNVFHFSFSRTGYFWLALASSLTILNWFFEARKWQILTSPFQSISLKIAYKSVLSGLATGLLTPNRLGNFMGRLVYLEPQNRINGTINTQLGNLAQFIISISLGFIGLVISVFSFEAALNPFVYGFLPLTMLVMALAFYFNPKLILRLPFGHKIYKTYKDTIDDLVAFPDILKRQTLALSAIRYFTFLLQYYCLFRIFEVDISLLLIFALSATTFLVTTVIPGIFMGKLLVRESAAVFVFGWIALPIQTILAVSFLLWFINLAIPAAFGWYFWMKQPKK